jgi:NADP-dependent 3-hydroxy acid dehydrogenase YdfG
VTGAAARIGFAVAARLGAAGHRVVLLDRDQAALDGLAAEPWMAARLPLRVVDPAGIERCFEEIGRRHGPTGILVNNAGVAAVPSWITRWRPGTD